MFNTEHPGLGSGSVPGLSNQLASASIEANRVLCCFSDEYLMYGSFNATKDNCTTRCPSEFHKGTDASFKELNSYD